MTVLSKGSCSRTSQRTDRKCSTNRAVASDAAHRSRSTLTCCQAADRAAQGHRLCRVLCRAHENQATELLVDSDDVRAVLVALNPPVHCVHPDDGIAWTADECVRYPATRL
jgi:hypothetical protein